LRRYISSTFEDLKEHRLAVRNAILRLGHHPVGMEDFGAGPTDPQTAALDKIKDCGAFVGFYAYRFGWIPSVDTRSITEQEFDYARAHKIRIISIKRGKTAGCLGALRYAVCMSNDWAIRSSSSQLPMNYPPNY
jgi:hypothetical protein